MNGEDPVRSQPYLMIDSWWLLDIGESVFFRELAPIRVPMLQWMTLSLPMGILATLTGFGGL